MLVLDADILGPELHSDGWFMFQSEAVIDELEQDAGFAHPCVPDDDELEDIREVFFIKVAYPSKDKLLQKFKPRRFCIFKHLPHSILISSILFTNYFIFLLKVII